MGPIEEALVIFDHEPVHAWLLPPPTFPPVMTSGVSGYKGRLTLSVGAFPQACKAVSVEEFFDAIIKELPD